MVVFRHENVEQNHLKLYQSSSIWEQQ